MNEPVKPREGGSLVAQVHQLSGRIFTRILKQHGVDDLNPAQGRIIYALWKEEPLSQTKLAERTKLDKSTLTLMLDRLEQAGQVARTQAPRDKRGKLVALTARNRALHGSYLAASRQMTSLFYRGLSEIEIDTFEGALKKILANLEETAEPS